ncbi:MAG: AAA family ATPase [Clostridia bacterium]|nr:AAA family ATPase [Clostridia bacterium]
MLVILSGVSGAGKDTIKKELIKRMENVISLPSFTSRNPRVGEEEGVQYHFITKEEFKEKIKNGEFYEYDIHHENYYGTSRKLMNEKIQSGKIIVKDIEVNGTENLIKTLKHETKLVTIFLKVDKEELKHRLINRGDDLSESEMELRLSRLQYEESKIPLYDYVIKNDELEKTVQVIMTIIENEVRLEGTI